METFANDYFQRSYFWILVSENIKYFQKVVIYSHLSQVKSNQILYQQVGMYFSVCQNTIHSLIKVIWIRY